MPKWVKLSLDIIIGAVAPIVILKYGTAYMGTLTAYLVAALVPVAWVLIDLFGITRHFNFITTYGGASAIMRGALAFWYVDGARFAFKDSASYLLAFVIFAGSAVIGTPVTRSIARQGLGPDTAERAIQLDKLLDNRPVRRAMMQAAWIIAAVNIVAGSINYLINYRMVLAPFNTPLFNDQVANVNAITRIVLVLPDLLALFFAFSLMYKAMYALLPAEDGTDPSAEDFWNRLAMREEALKAATEGGNDGTQDMAASASTSGTATGTVTGTVTGAAGDGARAARKARSEFGLS